MYKEKIVNIDSICKFLGSEIYRYLEEKEQTVIWLAELLNKSQPYISDLLNWRRSTSNLEIYKKMAISLWMSEVDFDKLLKKARKYEYEIATWKILDDNSDLLKNLKLEDLRLALSREFGTNDEAVLNDIIAYARFKIEQWDTTFLKNMLKD
jgi:hypothetical protein